MLFRAKPYLPPTSRAMQAAQHLKAFCGNSLPIGVRIEAHRDVSVPMDLLEEYRSPVDCLPARRKDSRYSNLAIVALNARGLSRTHTVNSLSWSPPAGAARPLLATLLSSPGGSFHTWNPQTQAVDTIRPACHIPASGYDAMLTAISWRSGGSEIATGSKAGVVSLFDMTKGTCGVHLRPYPPSTSRFHVSSLSWSGPDLLASAFSSGHLLISDIRCPADTRLIAEPASWTGCPGQNARRGPGGLSIVEWDPCSNGVYVSAGSDTGLVRIWDIRKGDRPMVSQRTRFAEIRSLAWSPSSSGLLAFTGPTRQSTTMQGRGISISGDGARECTGFLKLEKLSREAKVEYLDTSPTRIDRLLWAKDSPVLIACTSPEDLASYNSATVRADGVSRPRSNVDPGSLVNSPSSATPAPSHPIVFFSYPSMRQIAQLDGHARSIRHAALSNDGQTLVTGALEEVLRVWEVPHFIGNRAKGQGGAEARSAAPEKSSTIR